MDPHHPLFRELSQLNTEQYQAATTTKGHILVLAGAGSGKTRVLTLRIAYLILSQQVSPEAIVAMTFTNKAAGEMKERLTQLIGQKLALRVFIGTFHSYCLHVLKKYIHHLGYTEHFSLYSEGEVKRIFKQLAATYLDQKGELPPLEKSFHALQMAKTLGETPSDPQSKWHDQFLKNCFDSLKTSMRAFNAVDFDGLLELTCELFEKHPALMAPLLEKTEYVMIDEYQDSNPMQFKIASCLAAAHKNLFVVGDDDQSIYGWRGAKIENILHFPSDITLKLEQNYRSSPTILEAANAVISRNTTRHSKLLKSNRAEDHKLTLFHAPTDLEEAQSAVIKLIKLKEAMGLKFSDFAILYRSNALSRPFEMALNNMVYKTDSGYHRGIPYIVYGGVEFYERSEIKDLIAFLRLCLNTADQEALLRIINVPRKGLSDKTLDKITAFQRLNKCSLYNTLLEISHPINSHPLKQQLSSKALASLASFTSAIEQAREAFKQGKSCYETTKNLLEALNYQEAINEEVKSDKMRAFKQESLELYLQNLKQFEESNPERPLSEFIASSHLDEHFLLDKRKNTEAVSLMTLHSSKGLEFEVCFIVGLEDHILPHEKSVKQASIEEERRLFYVGLTRGKKKIVLTMAQNRSRNGKMSASTPSRFLFEIPEPLLEIVSHTHV